MMNRGGFRSYQSMNLIHRTKNGKELWLGDYSAASDISLLKQKNINHVLTSAAMLDISYAKQHNINHKIINAFDIPTYKMTPHFQEAFRFIEQALKKGNILVHCAAGISRSTTFVLVYLMRAEKMSFQQAIGYVRCKRSVICPNYGFENELKKYELQLKNYKAQKKEEHSKNYDNIRQKKFLFDFSADLKMRLLGSEEKLAATTGNNRNYLTEKNYGSKTINSYFPRGNSLNKTQQQRLDMFKDYKSNINRLGKGLLSFKLDVPKIITIKR